MRKTAKSTKKHRSSKKVSRSKKKNKKLLVTIKKYWYALPILIFGLLLLSIIIPVEYETIKRSESLFESEYKDDAGLELGEQNTFENGVVGENEITYKNKQSLFNYLFFRDKVTTELKGTTVVTESKPEIILKGTRRWQYMICSNGTYRYYSDEQFENPQTGFTSKSSDSCKENDQGYKLRLADNSTSTGAPTYSAPDSSEADKINREVEKLNWCTHEDKKVGDEYIGKVHYAQENMEYGSVERNTYLDASYFKYSNEVKLLRASGCDISSTYPDYSQ